VVVLATAAARQFTRPIYQLRRSARRLARGDSALPLQIATNDEIEDLASDFSAMAKQLASHHQNLEDLVADRTQALRKAHAELSDILEHSADAIVGLDLAGYIRVWNRGAEGLFGYTSAEAVGEDANALLVPDTDSRIEAEFIEREIRERGAVIDLHTERRSKTGVPFSVSLTQTLIRDDVGAPLGYSLIIRDTRDQKKLEEHLRRSERIAAVSVMAAGIAHELNNPLGVVGNRLECMEEEVREWDKGDHTGGFVRDLAVLREHVARMGDVTRELLRLAHDDEVNEDGAVRVGAVAARLTRLLKRTFSSRNVRLDTQVHEGVPSVRGSERGIETICMNLLLNAVDATPAGGTVTLSIRHAAERHAVELAVQDTGSGVPPELRHRIFEPFFTTKTAGHGTGLGLAVCRSIVDRHQGEMWLEDPDGGGSRFVVSLPLEPSELVWIGRASS
jgi:PAS domain S-box-containing protein